MENSPSVFRPWQRHWPTGPIDQSIYIFICPGAIHILSVLNGEAQGGIVRGPLPLPHDKTKLPGEPFEGRMAEIQTSDPVFIYGSLGVVYIFGGGSMVVITIMILTLS